MKKYLFVTCLILFAAFAKAQEDVIFKIKYLPNHTYQINGNNSVSFYTDLSAYKEIASRLAAQGISQPVNAYINYSSQGVVTTSKIATDKSFPVEMQFSTYPLTGYLNGKTIPIPTKKNIVKIYGNVSADGRINVDSLNSKKLTDSTAASAKTMMNKMMGMINFPEHPLKVGESFTQNLPFDFPMVKGMVINIKITYKLISVTDGKAYFDLTQGLDMNMNIKEVNINLLGSGIGKMVYDIKNNYPVSNSGDISMTINIKSDKFTGAATAEVKSKINYIIN